MTVLVHNAPDPDPGAEAVLIVEDESAVRELVTDILASAGYTVRTAGDRVQALGLLAGHGAPVHLVLTDIVMPDISGPSRAARPHPVLSKPFSGSEFRRAVRAVRHAPDGQRP